MILADNPYGVPIADVSICETHQGFLRPVRMVNIPSFG
jgi:hypothetical protein